MRKILLMITAAVLVLSVASCSVVRNMRNAVNAARSAALEPSGLVVERTETPAPDTSDARAETAAPEETQAPEAAPVSNGWPKDIPSDIPVFDYGEFDADQTVKIEAKNSLTYMMGFKSVTQDQVRKYGAALKEAGFDVTTTEGSGAYSVTGITRNDDSSSCTIMASWNDNSSSCSVSVSIYGAKAVKDPATSLQNHWPKEAPSDVPAFIYGDFDGSQIIRTERKTSIDYTLYYNNVTAEQVKGYAEALKKAGLDVTTTEGTNMYSVMGMKTKGYAASFTISVYWDAVSASCTVSVTINKAS